MDLTHIQARRLLENHGDGVRRTSSVFANEESRWKPKKVCRNCLVVYLLSFLNDV